MGITRPFLHIIGRPERGGGYGADNQWYFFTEKFMKLLVLCPFHLIDSELTNSLFIEKSKNKEKNTENDYDF